MSILICGPDTEKNRRVVAAIRAQWPDAELIFERDLVKIEEPEPQRVWVDEVSEFKPEPLRYEVAPNGAYLPIKREKVMHPWSRRKKR